MTFVTGYFETETENCLLFAPRPVIDSARRGYTHTQLDRHSSVAGLGVWDRDGWFVDT